jgi:protoheme IX farnesyltransferase
MISPATPLGDAARRSRRDVSSSLLALTEPRIVELLLVTAIPAMLVAQRGLPPIRVVLVTLTAVGLAAGSANTITCYVGRRFGAASRRVPGGVRSLRDRTPPSVPLTACPPAGSGALPVIRQAETLAFGIALGAAATVLLGTVANWLSAALADAAIVLFVLICTLRLTRGSRSGFVIGGFAGCFPVLVGWSAVTGTLSLLPIVLSAVILCWVPPRLWALAMESRSSTGAARETTPAAIGSAAADAAAGRFLSYSCVLLAAALGLAPYGGWVYTVCAVALGAWLLAEAHRVRSRAVRASGHPATSIGVAAAAAAGLIDLPVACLAQLLAVVMTVALLSPLR